MVEFVGRSTRLKQIDGWFADVAARRQGLMLSVRGRRQVGKSALYTEFLRRSNAPHVFFSAVKHATTASQLAQFARDVVSATSPIPDAATLFASAPASWNDAFGRLRLAATAGPIVVVIDEFPWAAEADPTIEGELQNAWDRFLQHLPVLLVLIGSDVTMMQRLTAHDRPLFGRAREDHLAPFNPAEVAAALGDRPAFDVFDAYLTTGGYPRLVDEFARSGGLDAFIAAALHDENSTLAIAAQRSLAAEFPTEAKARRVLSAIGGHEVGHPTFSGVVGRLDEPSAKAGEVALIRALQVLVDAKHVVAIDTPSGTAPNSRLRRYRISDPYLRLWFRFVEPQLANIARGRGDIAVQAFATGYAAWRGIAIEPTVRDAVARLAPDHSRLTGTVDVSAWWNRDNSVEIDIVARRSDEVLAVGTTKWRRTEPITSAEIDHLSQMRASVPGAAGAALVAVGPPASPGAGADITLTAEDLLKAWQP